MMVDALSTLRRLRTRDVYLRSSINVPSFYSLSPPLLRHLPLLSPTPSVTRS